MTSSVVRVLKTRAAPAYLYELRNMDRVAARVFANLLFCNTLLASLWTGAVATSLALKAAWASIEAKARQYCPNYNDSTSEFMLTHGWVTAGLTCVLVVPLWAVYLMCRLGFWQYAWAPVLAIAVVFIATLPMPWHVRLAVQFAIVAAVPWWCCGLALLFNLNVSSLLIGGALKLLWWEVRQLCSIIKPRVLIHESTKEKYKRMIQERACRWIWTIELCAKFVHLLVEYCERYNQTSLLWTKMLCFTYICLPLVKMRVAVIVGAEGLWWCAWNACLMMPTAWKLKVSGFAFWGETEQEYTHEEMMLMSEAAHLLFD